MEPRTTLPRGLRVLLASAAFVVIIAGLRAAAPIVVPFLLAIFIAIVFAPPMYYLRQRGLPAWLALTTVIVGVAAAGIAFVALAASTVDDFIARLPSYQARVQAQAGVWLAWLNSHGMELSGRVIDEHLNPAQAFKLVASLLKSLGGIAANGFLILLTVIFMLTEASGIPAKLRLALKDPGARFERLGTFLEQVNHYMAIKTWVSAATGALVAIGLAILKVDFALLWGLLAFALNFVPTIGSILAAVPAVLLALVQLGPATALYATGVFLGANVVLGNIVEPRFMGRGLGLSTLVVFLSLVFWGWVLGPVGMLLAVPLTMTVKLALDSAPDTRWLAVLLGSETEAPTPSAFQNLKNRYLPSGPQTRE
ncbi:MAG: AI-2E family transporter [Chromatiales bacterium]|nr:AI-2E family transporter [Chromatiales bacterium]